MLRIPNLIILLVSFQVSMASVSTAAKNSQSVNFNEVTIHSPFKLTQEVIPADVFPHPGKELLAFSIDKKANRWLMIYQWDQDKQQYDIVDKTIIPKEYYRFDLSKSRGGELQTIYFLSSTAITSYSANNKEPFTSLFKVSSLYIKDDADYLNRGNFIHDLNDDGVDDVVIASFKGVNIFIGQEDKFISQSLPILPEVRAFSSGATYTETPLYFADINFDRNLDVLSVADGEMIVYLQEASNQFNEKPITIVINESISSKEWWKKRDERGEKLDQSNLEYRMLEKLQDINADGIIDMVVRYTNASGVLDRSNDYEVYLGFHQQGKLAYNKIAETVIHADGTLTGIEFIDIDNDEKKEVLLAGFDIGVSEIIAALVTGGIDQNVYIFKMDDQDKFSAKPVIKKGVELTFSLSSGRTGSAVVKLADLNGDGLKDLVLSDDDDELKIYLGKHINKKRKLKKRQRVFEKWSLEYDIQLPRNGETVMVDDINNDGKDDLLFNYSRLDGKEQEFTVLFSN